MYIPCGKLHAYLEGRKAVKLSSNQDWADGSTSEDKLSCEKLFCMAFFCYVSDSSLGVGAEVGGGKRVLGCQNAEQPLYESWGGVKELGSLSKVIL